MNGEELATIRFASNSGSGCYLYKLMFYLKRMSGVTKSDIMWVYSLSGDRSGGVEQIGYQSGARNSQVVEVISRRTR